MSATAHVHVQVPLASAPTIGQADHVQGNASDAQDTPSGATRTPGNPGPAVRGPGDFGYAAVSGLRAFFRRGQHRLGDDPRRQWCMAGHA